jgi:hypothetical protein
MSLFADPLTHAANPPESWSVVKLGEHHWVLTTASGIGTLDTFKTRHAAEEAKCSGHLFDLYNDEVRWYAGESVRNWKPYALCSR